jgi:hypothetical protein
MAGKKPAKPMAGQAKQAVLDPEIYGISVKFFGMKTAKAVCTHCGRSLVRGMVRLKGNDYLCSLRCAEQSSKIVTEETGEPNE